MKNMIIAGLLCWACVACKKATELTYASPDNVYFDYRNSKNERVDSVIYSFALYPELATDTIWLPVALSGNRVAADRKFAASIIDSATTAVAGLHYKKLETAYTLPGNTGYGWLPLVLFGTDPALTSKTVQIKLQLESTSELGALYKKLDTMKILFSNRLEKPIWWDAWIGELGQYSRVKHELFIRVSGTTELPPTNSDATTTPRVLFYTRRFKAFLADPIQWITDNPSAGYTIIPTTNGNYYFYSITNPDKKYLLEYSAAVNKYFFRDENGDFIV
ncbi:DUF4843 domain-containing protein [Chitinophaga agrisoli]|nr:DUF4843 domain-containing protein [Chitinophaga agrisoli]